VNQSSQQPEQHTKQLTTSLLKKISIDLSIHSDSLVQKSDEKTQTRSQRKSASSRKKIIGKKQRRFEVRQLENRPSFQHKLLEAYASQFKGGDCSSKSDFVIDSFAQADVLRLRKNNAPTAAH